jgi:hypothetical protein
MGAAAEHGGWSRARVIPSTSPTCFRAAIEPSSACSPAAGVVTWHAHLRIVLVRGMGWS